MASKKQAHDPGEELFESLLEQTVELGNKAAEADPEADLWDIADGLLYGAVQFWLYSRQPCPDRNCTDCAPIATAEARMAELRLMLEQAAAESDYLHSENDRNVGHA